MIYSDASKLLGRVVVLDLVNGIQVCTRVEKVSVDGYLQAKHLVVFVTQADPATGNVQMHPVDYGAPLYQAG